jgi:Nucleotidyl transferase AbiEii toxin, Type IV TA system
MPVSDLHREVAGVALRAAARYGFALGGGNALIAHGVIDRPTEDIDLFTDREHGVAAAAGAVEAALRRAGYTAERQDKTAGLSEVFEGIGEGLAEWIITTPGGAQLMLQMAYFDRGRQPVLMELGPVLDLDDVIGGKVAALASRAAERDYIDVAAALARGYSVAQLTALALALDPGLAAEDFADAGQRLDRLRDDRFAPYGLTPEDVTRLRKRFAAWPRTPAPSTAYRPPVSARPAEQQHSAGCGQRPGGAGGRAGGPGAGGAAGDRQAGGAGAGPGASVTDRAVVGAHPPRLRRGCRGLARGSSSQLPAR